MKNISNIKQPHSGDELSYFEEDTISLYEILLILARQTKIIIITPIIIGIIAIVYVLYFTSPSYISIAKIKSSNSSNISHPNSIASQLRLINSDDSELQLAYPDVVQSRSFAKSLLQRKFDTEEYGQQKTLLQILTYGNNDPIIGIDTLIKFGVDNIMGMIKLETDGFFYKLTVTSREPVFSRDIAVAIIEELDSHQQEFNNAKVRETRIFIEERISDVGKDLNIAEEKLSNFMNRNRRIENSPALQLKEQRLSREVAVLIGVFTTLKQQLEKTKIDEVKKSDYVIVLDPPEVPLFPNKPNKKLIVIMASIFGIGLGIFFGFVRDYFMNCNKQDWENIVTIKSVFIQNIVGILGIRRFIEKSR